MKDKYEKMQKAVDAVRVLSVEAINKANSGHPGICLGAAPILVSLYGEFMRFAVRKKQCINRDRFILSAGHGAPMLYAVLYFMGAGITIEDMKNLRQLGSKTPGHPEITTPYIDAATGPLGQGVAMGVGMAIADKILGAHFNKPDFKLFDHFTYVLCGDGDLQEGVAQEAISLAGHLGLGRLIFLYDSNNVQLDGPTNDSYTENIKKKYQAMGLEYINVMDGNDLNQVVKGIRQARKVSGKPTIVEFKTKIGWGSPKEGDCGVHGSPLGPAGLEYLKEKIGWTNEPFTYPAEAYSYFNQGLKKGTRAYNRWNKRFEEYKALYPEEGALLEKALKGEYDSKLQMHFELGFKEATRVTGGKVLAELSKEFLTLVGGSADLTKSTKAKGADGNFSKENPLGRNICYGVREHAMGAITNGINLHGGLRSFSGAFFVFSDYMKPAIRMAALMGIPSIFVFTHDSIAVGEDGPTHEPIEQLAGLRSIPNLNVFRPADANETVAVFKLALKETTRPSVIVLTRQDVVTVTDNQAAVKMGGYLVKGKDNSSDLCFIASGSEVSLACDTANLLANEGINASVVSMPNMRAFDEQTKRYKYLLLPSRNRNISVEMSSSREWYQYAKFVYNIERFGESAKAEDLIKEYGFTKEALATYAKEEVLKCKE